MTHAVPFSVHVFNAKPHSRGNGTFAEFGRSRYVVGRPNDQGYESGPCITLVKDGKPLNRKGRELLRKPS